MRWVGFTAPTQPQERDRERTNSHPPVVVRPSRHERKRDSGGTPAVTRLHARPLIRWGRSRGVVMRPSSDSVVSVTIAVVVQGETVNGEGKRGRGYTCLSSPLVYPHYRSAALSRSQADQASCPAWYAARASAQRG